MTPILSGKEKLPPPTSTIELIKGFIGGTLSILCLLMIGKWSENLLIMAPFGATCVLLFAVPQSPLAQPRNIIFGHFISALVGLLVLKFWGVTMLSIAFSVGLAIVAMQFLRCVHPPAGANPLVILLSAHVISYSWSFLIFPVLLGSTVLVLIALLLNNFKNQSPWPHYFFALYKSKK